MTVSRKHKAEKTKPITKTSVTDKNKRRNIENVQVICTEHAVTRSHLDKITPKVGFSNNTTTLLLSLHNLKGVGKLAKLESV